MSDQDAQKMDEIISRDDDMSAEIGRLEAENKKLQEELEFKASYNAILLKLDNSVIVPKILSEEDIKNLPKWVRLFWPKIIKHFTPTKE